jgi:hypothetical protein
LQRACHYTQPAGAGCRWGPEGIVSGDGLGAEALPQAQAPFARCERSVRYPTSGIALSGTALGSMDSQVPLFPAMAP